MIFAKPTLSIFANRIGKEAANISLPLAWKPPILCASAQAASAQWQWRRLYKVTHSISLTVSVGTFARTATYSRLFVNNIWLIKRVFNDISTENRRISTATESTNPEHVLSSGVSVLLFFGLSKSVPTMTGTFCLCWFLLFCVDRVTGARKKVFQMFFAQLYHYRRSKSRLGGWFFLDSYFIKRGTGIRRKSRLVQRVYLVAGFLACTSWFCEQIKYYNTELPVPVPS
jgi:hypothetical protein